MGIRLVTQALSPQWGHLSETARLVLIAMCHTALDKPHGTTPARRYFGGHEQLILTITGQDSRDPDWAGSDQHVAAQRRMKRAMRQLVDSGAVEVITRANGKQKAVYEVLPRVDELVLPFSPPLPGLNSGA